MLDPESHINSFEGSLELPHWHIPLSATLVMEQLDRRNGQRSPSVERLR